MIRSTTILNRAKGEVPPRQPDLNVMWDFIEDRWEEDWRVNEDGSMSITVDELLLSLIAADFPEESLARLGEEIPKELMGTYTIKGVYDEHLYLTPTTRTYFFEQGY